MLINKLQADNVAALKANDKTRRTILTILINKAHNLEIELRRGGKSLTDADVNQVLIKTDKELDEELAGYIQANNLSMVEELKIQKAIVSEYLPKMLSEEQIVEEINKLDDKSLPNVMKYFKINFAGKVDMGLVSKIEIGRAHV